MDVWCWCRSQAESKSLYMPTDHHPLRMRTNDTQLLFRNNNPPPSTASTTTTPTHLNNNHKRSNNNTAIKQQQQQQQASTRSKPTSSSSPVRFLLLLVPALLLLLLLQVGSSSSRMGFLAPFRRAVSSSSASPAAAVGMGTHGGGGGVALPDSRRLPDTNINDSITPLDNSAAVQWIVAAALWSFFAGDALAAPTHWFYGGPRQIQQYYGRHGIASYTKPVTELPGSILNKSNLAGGGRSTPTTIPPNDTIIGHVINHGKQAFWDPSRSIHYHATLQAGENTLEAQLGRVLLRSLAATDGTLDVDHFRQSYVTFMTTPGSHNDTYASTCHRMFFANWHYKKRDPMDCPDNDKHNVDTVDGLVLPTIAALAVALHPTGTATQAASSAAATVAVTRNSPLLQRYAQEWAAVVFETVRSAATTNSQQSSKDDSNSYSPVSLKTLSQTMARNLGLRTPKIQSSADEITACYLDSAVPAMLDTLLKYEPHPNKKSDVAVDAWSTDVWNGLLANANTGGENVHRASCLGAVWGAAAAAAVGPPRPSSLAATASPLATGLYHHDEIQAEIEALLQAVHGGVPSAAKEE